MPAVIVAGDRALGRTESFLRVDHEVLLAAFSGGQHEAAMASYGELNYPLRSVAMLVHGRHGK